MFGKSSRFPWVVASVVLVVSVGFISCAKQGLPPGGAVDRTPPGLLESDPPSGATDVPLTASVRLVFSEKLDGRSFERGFSMNPRVRLAKLAWSDAEVTLVPIDSLYDDTTYVMVLASAIEDRRSNAIPIPVVLGFSTGSAIDRAVLVGRVLRGGKPSAHARVWLYVWTDERESDPEVDVPYRQTETDGEGNFLLPFLRPGGRSYELFAYKDANRTGAFEEGDPWGFFQEPVTVAAYPETTGGIEVELWDSARTGRILGMVSGRWEPQGRLRLSLTAPGDSSATRVETLSQPGPFRLSGIPPGKYVLSVYQDVNGNERCDDEEELREPSAALPDTLEIVVGEPLWDVEIGRDGDEQP